MYIYYGVNDFHYYSLKVKDFAHFAFLLVFNPLGLIHWYIRGTIILINTKITLKWQKVNLGLAQGSMLNAMWINYQSPVSSFFHNPDKLPFK